MRFCASINEAKWKNCPTSESEVRDVVFKSRNIGLNNCIPVETAAEAACSTTGCCRCWRENILLFGEMNAIHLANLRGGLKLWRLYEGLEVIRKQLSRGTSLRLVLTEAFLKVIVSQNRKDEFSEKPDMILELIEKNRVSLSYPHLDQ